MLNMCPAKTKMLMLYRGKNRCLYCEYFTKNINRRRICEYRNAGHEIQCLLLNGKLNCACSNPSDLYKMR
jgi:thioredoxin-related protein